MDATAEDVAAVTAAVEAFEEAARRLAGRVSAAAGDPLYADLVVGHVPKITEVMGKAAHRLGQMMARRQRPADLPAVAKVRPVHPGLPDWPVGSVVRLMWTRVSGGRSTREFRGGTVFELVGWVPSQRQAVVETLTADRTRATFPVAELALVSRPDANGGAG
jgi:hypothetical protein